MPALATETAVKTLIEVISDVTSAPPMFVTVLRKDFDGNESTGEINVKLVHFSSYLRLCWI